MPITYCWKCRGLPGRECRSLRAFVVVYEYVDVVAVRYKILIIIANSPIRQFANLPLPWTKIARARSLRRRVLANYDQYNPQPAGPCS